MISITFKKWFCNVNIRVYFEKLDKCIIIIGKYSQQLQLLCELVSSSFLLVQQGQVQHLTGSSFSLPSYSFNFINGDRHRSKILIISHYLGTAQLSIRIHALQLTQCDMLSILGFKVIIIDMFCFFLSLNHIKWYLTFFPFSLNFTRCV